MIESDTACHPIRLASFTMYQVSSAGGATLSVHHPMLSRPIETLLSNGSAVYYDGAEVTSLQAGGTSSTMVQPDPKATLVLALNKPLPGDGISALSLL